MEAKFFKFQCFLFSDYDEINANPDNINFFVQKFLPLNFLPKQIQEVSLEIKNMKDKDFKQELVNRIGLSSLDRKWEIKFGKNRLSLNYSFDYSIEEDFTFDVFNEKVIDYLKIIEEKFPKKFLRLGVIVETLLPLEEEKRNEMFLKFNNVQDFYKDSFPIEWSNKVVVRKKLNNLNQEIVNVSNLNSFVEAKINSGDKSFEFNGIRNVIDINTLSFITNKRFDIENVNVFLREANYYVKKLLEDNKL